MQPPLVMAAPVDRGPTLGLSRRTASKLLTNFVLTPSYSLRPRALLLRLEMAHSDLDDYTNLVGRGETSQSILYRHSLSP